MTTRVSIRGNHDAMLGIVRFYDKVSHDDHPLCGEVIDFFQHCSDEPIIQWCQSVCSGAVAIDVDLNMPLSFTSIMGFYSHLFEPYVVHFDFAHADHAALFKLTWK